MQLTHESHNTPLAFLFGSRFLDDLFCKNATSIVKSVHRTLSFRRQRCDRWEYDLREEDDTVEKSKWGRKYGVKCGAYVGWTTGQCTEVVRETSKAHSIEPKCTSYIRGAQVKAEVEHSRVCGEPFLDVRDIVLVRLELGGPFGLELFR
jgi:hypothetical protein